MTGVGPLRRFFLLLAAAGWAYAPSAGAADHPSPHTWTPAGSDADATFSGLEKGPFIDLLAADFFEADLRLAQSRRIEAQTANRYLSMSQTDRARYRAARKQIWRAMSDKERAALRGAKRPLFSNLDDTQKQTFRRIAAEELGSARSSARMAQGDI